MSYLDTCSTLSKYAVATIGVATLWAIAAWLIYLAFHQTLIARSELWAASMYWLHLHKKKKEGDRNDV